MLNSILVILFCIFALAFVLLAKHSMEAEAETHKHWAFTLLSAIPPFIIATILLMLNNR